MFNVDESVKSRIFPYFVIPAPHKVRDKLQPGSSDFGYFWTPAFAGVTGFGAFYGFINVGRLL